MFVEGVRLFVVVLGTAAGFWAARNTGVPGDGLGGMLGCLLGYVAGGFFGRLLSGLGEVERRVETTSPVQFIAGTLGAIVGGALALVLVLPFAVLLSIRVAAPIAGLAVWIMGWLGFRVSSHQSISVLESLGMSTRPLVRAAGVQCPGRIARRHLGVDGRPAPSARTRRGGRWRSHGCPVRARRDPGLCRLGGRHSDVAVVPVGSRCSKCWDGKARRGVRARRRSDRARRGRCQADRARVPASTSPAHERRPARSQRRVAGCAHVQSPQARGGARAGSGARRFRARWR